MADLPTGTVTFLFTDIEGSTRLWEEQPDAMPLVLARHDALLRAAIETNRGVVFKTIGDAFCAAFPTAPEALDATLAGQRHLLRAQPATLSPQLSLRVRMALHTGAAELREGDYFGGPVNRVARLLAAAHGGQVVLSGATQELVRDELPPGAALLDLGVHALRDLQRAEHVFQLLHPDLPADFPPLRSLSALPNNLPVQLTSFVGREAEIARIKELLESARLLTLTGSGGCGKTRLALQVAAEVLESFSDGAWLVDLAPLTDADLVVQAVASALSVREEPGRSLAQTLADALSRKRLLLILDNCEHLLGPAAALVERLLRSCPELRVLATSRERLAIGGETPFRVPSLALPDRRRLPPPEQLAQCEAVRLFLERAAAVSPGLELNARTAPAIAHICRQLDGIPLALELAAARVRSLPVEQLCERLDDRFRLLTGGSRTALPRQQTLRALIDWSYDLLSESERELFHRVSVFVDGFTLEAAEAVCGGEWENGPGIRVAGGGEWELGIPIPPFSHSPIRSVDILDLTAQLVDRSLLSVEEQDGRARYGMLSTLRQYAREKLQQAGQSEAVRHRHLEFFLDWSADAERKLRGHEQVRWLERLEAEHENLRAALDFAAEHAPEAGLRLAGTLWWFWHVRGHFSEGREWLSEMLSRAPESPHRAKALHGAGVLARNQGDLDAARRLSAESLALKRAAGDLQGIAAALNNMGTLALAQADYAAARPCYEESLAIERGLGNRQGITASLIGLANVALEQGEYESAATLYSESLRLKEELGDRRGIATALGGLGSVALARGDFDTAARHYEQSLRQREVVGDRRGIAHSLSHLASVALARGDLEYAGRLLAESETLRRELGDKLGTAHALQASGHLALRQGLTPDARRCFQESLRLYDELSHRNGLATALEAFAMLLAVESGGEDPQAARLLGAASALRALLGAPLPPSAAPELGAAAGRLRDALGRERFQREWEAGRAAGPRRIIDGLLAAEPLSRSALTPPRPRGAARGATR